MSYRDDLVAAHTQIENLKQEIKSLQEKLDKLRTIFKSRKVIKVKSRPTSSPSVRTLETIRDRAQSLGIDDMYKRADDELKRRGSKKGVKNSE